MEGAAARSRRHLRPRGAKARDKQEEAAAEVRRVCKRFKLAPGVERRALGILECVQLSGIALATSGEVDKVVVNKGGVWAACALFLACALVDAETGVSPRSRRRTATPLKLRELLAALQVSLVELLENVRPALEEAQKYAEKALAQQQEQQQLSQQPFEEHEPLFYTAQSPRTRRRAEHQVVTEVSSLALTRSKREVLFKKFQNLWELARDYLPFGTNGPAAAVTGTGGAERGEKSDLAFSNAWLLFILACRRLRTDEPEAGELLWHYNMLVGIVYLARFAPGQDGENRQAQPAAGRPARTGPRGSEPPPSKRRRRGAVSPVHEENQVEALLDEDETMFEPPVETPSVDDFFAHARVDASKARGMAAVVRDMLAAIARVGELGPELAGADAVGTPEQLRSETLHDALSRFVEEQYVRRITDLDDRSFLEDAASGGPAATPMKSGLLSSLNISNASAEHKISKQVTEAARAAAEVSKHGAQTVNKALFGAADAPAPASQVPGKAGAGPARGGSGCMSPVRSITNPTGPGAQSFTPVSNAIEANNWLSRELTDAPQTPSERLLRFFRECDADPTAEVTGRVAAMSATLARTYNNTRSTVITKELFPFEGVPPATERCPDSTVDDHLACGTKLYYRVLESILRGESSRLGTLKFDSLLHSNMFHRALFACCMEVIFRSKEVFRLTYPALAECLGVPAFELLKVLESFVNYVPMLPRLLCLHMRLIETDILEEAAWADSSPMFALLERRRSLDARSSGGAVDGSLRPLELFFRKALTMSHERMKALYVKLGYSFTGPGAFYKELWDVFRAGVNRFPEQLLRGRHLDHVLLCSIYGVCRAKRLSPEVSFKRILREYRDVVLANEQDSYAHLVSEVNRAGRASGSKYDRITQGIPLKDGKRGDLVAYYNAVYISLMKETILELRTKGVPLSSTRQNQSLASPGRAALRPRERAAGPGQGTTGAEGSTENSNSHHMTPRTKALWAYGESPAHNLRLASRRTRSRLQRNPIEEEEDEEGAEGAGEAACPRSASPPRPFRSSSRIRIQNLLHRQARSPAGIKAAAGAAAGAAVGSGAAAAAAAVPAPAGDGRRRGAPSPAGSAKMPEHFSSPGRAPRT